MGKGKRNRELRKAQGGTVKQIAPPKSGPNRASMRKTFQHYGILGGHSRKSPSKYKVHQPTLLELEDWADWKAEQK